MTKLKNEMNLISRREFLKNSGLSAGGLMIAVSLPLSVSGSVKSTGFERPAVCPALGSGDRLQG